MRSPRPGGVDSYFLRRGVADVPTKGGNPPTVVTIVVPLILIYRGTWAAG